MFFFLLKSFIVCFFQQLVSLSIVYKKATEPNLKEIVIIKPFKRHLLYNSIYMTLVIGCMGHKAGSDFPGMENHEKSWPRDSLKRKNFSIIISYKANTWLKLINCSSTKYYFFQNFHRTFKQQPKSKSKWKCVLTSLL